MKSILRNERGGYLLPMVIIYAFVMMIVGFGILHLGSLERISSLKRVNQTKAFYLAEAGVNRLISQINQGKTLSNIEETTVISGNWQGTYEVVLDSEDNPTYATVTGEVKNFSSKIKIELEEGSGGIFSRGVFGNDYVYVKKNSMIFGYDSRIEIPPLLIPLLAPSLANVGSNNLIEVTGSGKIYGDASVSPGGIISGGPGAITGEKNYDAEERIIPPVEIPDDLKNLAYTQQGNPGLTGIYTINANNYSAGTLATINTGNYRFQKFTVNGLLIKLHINGVVRIYIEKTLQIAGDSQVILDLGSKLEVYLGEENGDLQIQNSARVLTGIIPAIADSPSSAAIYIASTKTPKLQNDCSFCGVIYAPLAEKFTIQNSAKLYGNVVTKKLYLKDNAKLYEDIALRDVSPPGDPGESGITISRWTKPDWKKRLE